VRVSAWSEKLLAADIPPHIVKHLSVMTELNKQGRYDDGAPPTVIAVNVLWTAAWILRKRCADPADLNRCILRSRELLARPPGAIFERPMPVAPATPLFARRRPSFRSAALRIGFGTIRPISVDYAGPLGQEWLQLGADNPMRHAIRRMRSWRRQVLTSVASPLRS
jgi:hypothetical protein